MPNSADAAPHEIPIELVNKLGFAEVKVTASPAPKIYFTVFIRQCQIKKYVT